jgi:uncharacterized LabA/DUF88 family protein
MINRVITYIDGFNLYFGLKSKNWRKYYWLDLVKLSNNLLKPDQELITTKYFTARIEHPEDKRKRQLKYIEALDTLQKIQIYYGKYLSNPVVCKNCGYKFFKPSEKETDVNIAIELLTDAIMDQYDTAIIISGDSDLVPAIKRSKYLFEKKRFIIAFPPGRVSSALKKEADGYFSISESKLRKSRFLDMIKKEDGYIIHKPDLWK